MLTCRDVVDQADAFLDQELSVWKKIRIRSHLSICNGCSVLMTQMRTTRSLISDESRNDAHDDGFKADSAKIDAILGAVKNDKRTGR